MTIKENTTGFTLVELLVSVALFTVVMLMAVGALLTLIDANARAQNMQQVMTNISFALDSMTREIRTGRGFYCSNSNISDTLPIASVQDCNSGSQLSIVEGGESLTGSANNSRITFRFNAAEQSVERRIANENWYPITAPGVNITEMYFSVAGSETGRNGDDTQANVTIFISGFAGELKSTESSFAIQTTITKRVLDI
jgi:prepilin-type N-terminal cleavage/methylation domain-containing protein